MSHPFWYFVAVPLAGYIVLAIGTLLLSRREPNTRPRAYILLALVVGLGTFLVWNQVQNAIDRRWAINRADSSERALAQQTEWLPRLLTMGAGANAALNVGRTERAAYWAQQLLDLSQGHEDDLNYGCAIHTGNIILGRIALQRGDIQAGKRHLRAAGNTPGSPTLNSFGPDMLLARDLLALGEKETVLQYLDRCQAFWDRSELQQWKLAIARDEMPDFEENFHY
jgi:hypothetical protein